MTDLASGFFYIPYRASLAGNDNMKASWNKKIAAPFQMSLKLDTKGIHALN